MKIGPPPDNSLRVGTAPPQVPQKGSQSASSTSGAPKRAPASGVAVTVTVSTLARTLEAASAGEADDIDAQKVEAVKTAIQQGTYKVNAEAIADKLLANAQEMLNRTRK